MLMSALINISKRNTQRLEVNTEQQIVFSVGTSFNKRTRTNFVVIDLNS